MAARDPKDAEREVPLDNKRPRLPVRNLLKEVRADQKKEVSDWQRQNPDPNMYRKDARGRDAQTERTYEGIREAHMRQYAMRESGEIAPKPRPPRPIDDRSDNPPDRRPEPMIRHGVGPVHQLSSKTAHTYGYTPEAYDELSRIPTRLDPGDPRLEENAAIGVYFPNTLHNPGGELVLGNDDPGLMAHEQAHGWWDRKGMQYGEMYPEVRGEQFDPLVRRWGRNEPWAAGAMELSDQHPAAGTEWQPTESHAYLTMGMYPEMPHRQNMPEEIRPYFRGFLSGLDEPGPPLPPPNYMESLWTRRREQVPEGFLPDENGNWG